MTPERRARINAIKLVTSLAREISDAGIDTYPIEPKSHKWTHVGLRGMVGGSSRQFRESLAASLIIHGWKRDTWDQRMFKSDGGVELLVLNGSEAGVVLPHSIEVIAMRFANNEFREPDPYARKFQQGGRWVKPQADNFVPYLKTIIPHEYQDRLTQALR